MITTYDGTAASYDDSDTLERENNLSQTRFENSTPTNNEQDTVGDVDELHLLWRRLVKRRHVSRRRQRHRHIARLCTQHATRIVIIYRYW